MFDWVPNRPQLDQYKVKVSIRYDVKRRCVNLRQNYLNFCHAKQRSITVSKYGSSEGERGLVSCFEFTSLPQELREECKLTIRCLYTCKSLLLSIFSFKITLKLETTKYLIMNYTIVVSQNDSIMNYYIIISSQNYSNTKFFLCYGLLIDNRKPIR